MPKDKNTREAAEPTPSGATDTTEADREAELASQLAVVDAVFGATHDEAGEPVPIVVEVEP